MQPTSLTPSLTTAARSKYVLEVLLQHQPKRVNIRADITAYVKHGDYGNYDQGLLMCGEYGCKGIFTEAFSLSRSEVEQIEKVGAEEIAKWPQHIKMRYDTWHIQPTICPICKVMAKRCDLATSYVLNAPLERIALATTALFRVLDSDADLVMRIMDDPNKMRQARRVLLDRGERTESEKLLAEARKNHHVYYRLATILRDAQSGASIESLIHNFLKA